jgi:SAM-dependent methyltransferase
VADPRFRADLYRGTADWYDTYRLPYPQELIDDLARRAGADGTGRLLDLACGTGKVAFALRNSFAEIWAADQEPDMIDMASSKAAASKDAARFRFVTGAAEDLDLPAGTFDLVTVGNAFHRLRRDIVAGHIRRWLRPDGHLALLWGGTPTDGDEPWQQMLRAVMQRWQDRNGADQRLPPSYAAARRARPDLVVLAEAGFELAREAEVGYSRSWTLDEIAGFVASTSVLSLAALGDRAPEFDAELRDALRASQPSGGLRQYVTFRYQLARMSLPESTG